MGGKKAGGGFLGVGGQSGFLNTGLFSSGPQKIKGFSMTPEARQAESEAIQRQRAIASGQAPSIANMQLQQNLEQVGRQAQSLAASQRGSSNPALAFRQAQLAQQQAGMEGAQQGAILAEQERRIADEFLARQAAAQRGVALQQSTANLQAQQQNQATQAGFLGSLGASAATLGSGGEKKKAFTGGVIPGEAKKEGDHPDNDTETYQLSPGEIVIPRSAAKDKKSAMEFLDAIKFENEKFKGKNKEKESEGLDVASMAKLFHEMTKLKGK